MIPKKTCVVTFIADLNRQMIERGGLLIILMSVGSLMLPGKK